MVKFIVRYRRLIILLGILPGIASCFLIPLLKTDPEMRHYVPSTLKSRIETDKIEKEFGFQDMVVIIFSDSMILKDSNLYRIRDIDKGLSRLKGISNRISPFTMKTIRSEEGMMVAGKLVLKIPDDSVSMNALKRNIRSDRFAAGTVFSTDLSAAAITVTLDNTDTERKTLDRIDSVLAVHPGKAVVLKGGLPYIRKYIMEDVRKDAMILVPAALLVMLIVLKLSLHDWKSVMMPFSVVLISTLMTLGLITVAGWKMSIMTLLVPVILIAVANNYGIYLVARYQEITLQNPGLSNTQVLTRILQSLNMPVIFSGLTTIAGILGLLTHSITAARQVGILAASGVTIALIMSLVFIPAMICGRKQLPQFSSAGKNGHVLFERMLKALSARIIRNPGRILVVSGVFILILSSGIFLLKIDTNEEDLFPEDHPVRQAAEVINSKFGGSQTVSAMVSCDIKDPSVLKGIDSITMMMEKQKGVGNVFSISQAVKEMTKAIYDRNEAGYNTIPDSREAVAQLFELYNMSGDPGDFSQIMNSDKSSAQILVRLNTPDNKNVMSIREILTRMNGKFPADLTVGGYAIIMSDFARSIISGQISSLLFALITVFLLLALIFRSVRGGLIGSIPLAASILILFGIMGFGGIALDAATALLSSVMIGVGVDFTIQYIWSYNSFLTQDFSEAQATEKAIATIGRSIIINASGVIAGFSILIFSGFTSIRFFGYLVVISIGACLIGAVVLIPAFLLRFRPSFAKMNFLNFKIMKK